MEHKVRGEKTTGKDRMGTTEVRKLGEEEGIEGRKEEEERERKRTNQSKVVETH